MGIDKECKAKHRTFHRVKWMSEGLVVSRWSGFMQVWINAKQWHKAAIQDVEGS